MKLTGAEIIIKSLIEQGCDTVFGYPGGFVLNIYDELYKSQNDIRHIISVHEQGAAHAADGYARTTGKPGVVIATSGPGATNLVTGIATAYLDSTPLIAITGNVPLSQLGRDSFQEVDTMSITMPITKHNYIVKDVKKLAMIIREAFEIAINGRPGPVLIDIPKDVQTDVCQYIPAGIAQKHDSPKIKYDMLPEIIDVINSSERPYIYCGGGAVSSDAGKEITELAEKIDAPIGCSMMGLSGVPTAHPQNLGLIGMHGRYASTKTISRADLIIAAGVRFSDRATGNKEKFTENTKIIHIDIDPAEINKNIPVLYGLIGDLKVTLRELISLVKSCKHEDWQKEIKEIQLVEAQHNTEEDAECLSPKSIISSIQNHTDKHTIYATDVGQHQMWAAQFCRLEKPRTLLTSGGLGTMGFGMGAAIGGSIATNGGRTILFTGDGSFGMNLNELATAVTNNLPLIVVIFNNGVLGMVRQWQTIFYDKRYSNTTLNRKTDFVLLAQAFGAKAHSVSTQDELNAALVKAFSNDGPTVIDCKINCDARVLPMIPPGGSIEEIIMR